MSTLVKETGLPKSAFYHHFESKAGLLSAVMAQGAQDFYDAMREAQRNPPADAPLTFLIVPDESRGARSPGPA
ncbi:TetR/AcrR family transcriptional regulator [Microtetraspora malaysiensis]|uniref:TetR/AcrR family transcriptional regulator n=1 Tax=Microtetraspora malaysiensis TaxID=161358 RepID=UPI003D8DB59C